MRQLRGLTLKQIVCREIMSKLIYPVDDLYGKCKDNIERSAEQIRSAINEASFDAPGDIGGLGALSGTLTRHLNELNKIDARIREIDKSYRALSDELLANAEQLVVTKMEVRERLIK